MYPDRRACNGGGHVSTFFSVVGAIGIAIALVTVSLLTFLVTGAIFGIGVGVAKVRDALSTSS
jgi:hypothetical protein